MSWAGQVPCHPVEIAGCVYVEVPKAGCTSVKWALSPLKGGPPSLPDENIHPWFGYTHAHGVGELQDWLANRWAGLFRFTLVRDPIARFRSFYYGLELHERGCYGDINRYILTEFESDAWRKDIHAVPQTLLIGDELHLFDLVGRLEDIDTFEKELRLHVSEDIRIPHMNRKPADREPLTEEAVERLRDIYQHDFEVLGYV